MDILNINVKSDTTGMIIDILCGESDEEKRTGPRGGSRPGRVANVERDSERLYAILCRQDLSADQVYDHSTSRCRFRVSILVNVLLRLSRTTHILRSAETM